LHLLFDGSFLQQFPNRRSLTSVALVLLQCLAVYMLYGVGLSAESDPDAVGESDNGHARITRPSYRAADRRVARAEAVRTHQAAHLQDYDEKHRRTRHLPAGHRFHHPIRRYTSDAAFPPDEIC